MAVQCLEDLLAVKTLQEETRENQINTLAFNMAKRQQLGRRAGGFLGGVNRKQRIQAQEAVLGRER